MLTFYLWLGRVMSHTAKAKWTPTEVGLESKAGKLKT